MPLSYYKLLIRGTSYIRYLFISVYYLARMRFVAFFIFFLMGLTSHGQGNLSFEPDSNGLTGWTSISGKSGAHALKLIGAIPFSATNGSYFMVLENDSAAANPKGMVADTFAYTSSPKSLSFDAFYLPATLNQYALFTIKFIKSGTLLYNHTDTIKPIFSGVDTLAVKWNQYNFNLPTLSQQPDTCIIIFTADHTTPFTGKPILFIDYIRFSLWNVGIPISKAQKVELYPNPASNQVQLSIPTAGIQSVTITDICGKLVSQSAFGGITTAIIDVSAFINGYYQLIISDSAGKQYTEKLLIWK